MVACQFPIKQFHTTYLNDFMALCWIKACCFSIQYYLSHIVTR